jgi:hypothetical protein
MTNMNPEISIVVESYNFGEGSGLDRLSLALDQAVRMANEHGNTEVLMAETTGDTAVRQLMDNSYPQVQVIDAVGYSYDVAKMKASAAARAAFILFLDGDVIPSDGWMDAHLRVLRSDGVVGTTGFTRYDGGYMGSLSTVLDFGFLLPPAAKAVGCYAFNNTGFRKGVLQEIPIPEGPMRCGCFAHAQILERRGTPIQMVPEAVGVHELPPFFEERFRQGFDLVAACWVNPQLPEARLLSRGVFAAPFFYLRAVRRDHQRLRGAWRELGLTRTQAIAGLALLPFLRLVDLFGMARALLPGGQRSGVGLPDSA